MHALELNSLASVIARHAEAHLALGKPVTPKTAQSYWLTMRYRHALWSEQLAAHRMAIQRPGALHRHHCWQEILPVIQEVLLSEPLTRGLAYHAQLMEHLNIDHDLAALATSALGVHLEARHRCLHLILYGTGLSPELAVGLNRLRRLLEQFNDRLLALMPLGVDLSDYCFDFETTAICQRQLQRSRQGAGSHSWFVMQASFLNCWLPTVLWGTSELCTQPANSRLNARLGQAVLQMLPSSLFGSFGIPQTPQFFRYGDSGLEADGQDWPATEPGGSPLSILTSPSRDRPSLKSEYRRW